MRAGGFEEGKACLRAKIDMASPFIVMRDPVLYRIKFAEHHQTGRGTYPMYDFTHCISDALEGITHSLCTLEFQDENRGLLRLGTGRRHDSCSPRQYEFSRLNLEYTVMSKRKLNLLVTSALKAGMTPRMPTISGLRRGGYTAASIREFCKRIGVTKQDNTIEMASLESCIREDLNENAPRAMAVIDPVKLVIENYQGEGEMVTMPNHPDKTGNGQPSGAV